MTCARCHRDANDHAAAYYGGVCWFCLTPEEKKALDPNVASMMRFKMCKTLESGFRLTRAPQAD